MKHRQGWFDRPENLRLFLRLFFAGLGVLLIADLFVHKHGEFYWENVPGFFAAYGYVSCVLLVLVAKVLRRLIRRDENYYDD
ncbi:MAG: hypothetical protein K9M82_05410 [Deltaproteobacteria bacterium]|nr:hypothetical protein [Deltaproteobacteria bacterium]